MSGWIGQSADHTVNIFTLENIFSQDTHESLLPVLVVNLIIPVLESFCKCICRVSEMR